MKFPLLLAIRLYWQLWPRRMQRCCLFRETCSHHVYRVAAEAGLWAGLSALHRRFRSCRSGYRVSCTGGGVSVHLADGTGLSESEASPSVLAPYHATARALEMRLNRAS